jgi:hypothetical protein
METRKTSRFTVFHSKIEFFSENQSISQKNSLVFEKTARFFILFSQNLKIIFFTESQLIFTIFGKTGFHGLRSFLVFMVFEVSSVF